MVLSGMRALIHMLHVATSEISSLLLPVNLKCYVLQGDVSAGWGLYRSLFVDDYGCLLHVGPGSPAGGGHSVPAIHHAVTGCP